MPTPRARAIAREVLAERDRQDAKWGRHQLHITPDGTGPISTPLHFIARPDLRLGSSTFTDAAFLTANLIAQAATDDTDTHAAAEEEGYGPVTYTHIMLEEVFEALAEEPGSEGLRDELIQVAAVALKWIEAIDLRSPDVASEVSIRRFVPAHAFIVFLLSETAGATSTRLERLWAAKVARSGDLAWPFISGSGLRTRLSELARWGFVEWSGEWGRTVANRPAKVWRLTSAETRRQAIADGTAIAADVSDRPAVSQAFTRLMREAGDDIVTRAFLESVASAVGF